MGRQAVLVEDIEEGEPICHRDPGIAHPDVEITLVFLIGLLRQPGALGGHPPRMVGLGSHDLPSVASTRQSDDDMPLAVGVCSISDSVGTIFALLFCACA